MLGKSRRETIFFTHHGGYSIAFVNTWFHVFLLQIELPCLPITWQLWLSQAALNKEPRYNLKAEEP